MHFSAHDVRHGARRLLKSPGFTVVAILNLALGMGAATAIFSVVDTVLLKPLPFRQAERLLVIWERNPSQNRFRLFVPPVNFVAWQKRTPSVEQMAALQENVHVSLTGGPNGYIEPEELRCERVSAGLFPLLGVQARPGRTFLPEEDQPGRETFAILSHSLWQRRFGGAPDIAGKSIRLRGQPYTVVGVLPPDFAVLEPGIDVFLPLGLDFSDSRTSSGRFLTVIARRRGSLQQVRSELDSLGAQLEQAQPALNQGFRPSVFVLAEELVGGVEQALWVLLAAVGCLLLMSCVNVANLLLARGAARRKEIALRTALGATRGHIVAQLLTESILLALGGGVGGLLLASGAIYLVAHFGPATVPRLSQAAIDLRLFAFALAVSLATGILFGLAPVLQALRSGLNAALNEGGRGGTASRTGRRVRHILVVTEVALAMMVLIAAGLLIRSFVSLRSLDPGFRPARVLTFRVPLTGGRNAAADRRAAFFNQATARIAALPGVQAVGAINGLPLTGLGLGAYFTAEGRPAPSADKRPQGLMRSVLPGYFGVMGIPLLAGRAVAAPDTAASPPVVVVSRTLARRLWPDGNAIGQRLQIDSTQTRVAEIVGIAGDVKADRIDGEEWPTLYNPYAQVPASSMSMVVRTSGAPLALAAAVTRELHRLDPDQVVADIRSMDDVVGLAVAGARFNTALLGVFAAAAFVLAAVGIYGVIAYDVSRRTHEIGLRLALGAHPAHVRRLILGQGARLAVYGIVAGIAGAVALTRWMAAMLYGVSPTDVWTFAAISLLLAVVALVASYLPSRRAMALDPVTALRHE